MRRWTLLIAVLVLVAARLAADGHGLVERALEGLGFAAAAFAALSFRAGDPPRLPWILRAAAIGLVLVAHLVGPLHAGDGPRIDHGILIVANLLGAAAMLRFLQVVRSSGLTAPASGAARLILAALLVGAGAALTICVVGLAGGPLGSAATQLRALTLAVSATADAIVFVIAARLVQALAPMRDGLAAQPYLLLAVDGLSFLLIDLGHAIGPDAIAPALVLPVMPVVPVIPVMPVIAAIGGAAGLLAALSQARIVRRF